MKLRARLPLIIALFLFACSPVEISPTVTPTTEMEHPTVTVKVPTETRPPSQTPPPTFTIAPPALTVSPTSIPVWQFCSPLAEQSLAEISEIISDPYNPPLPGKEDRHHGVDLAYYRRKDRTTIEGEIVQAILPGTVILVLHNQLPYGNMVIIETLGAELPPELASELGVASGESLYHLYAHFRADPLVEMGQWVECGQPLGEVGATGYNIVNPHLHLETRIGPSGVDFSDGMAYYDTRATQQERINYELWRTSGVFRHLDPMFLVDFFLNH